MLQVILFALQSDLRLCSELPGSGSRIKPPWERLGGGSGDWWKNQPFQKDTLWTKHHIMKQEANYKKHFEMNYISYISLYLVPARDMLNSTWNRTSNVLTQFCSTFFPRSFFSTKKNTSFPGAFSLLDSINWASSWLTWDSWLLSRRIATATNPKIPKLQYICSMLLVYLGYMTLNCSNSWAHTHTHLPNTLLESRILRYFLDFIIAANHIQFLWRKLGDGSFWFLHIQVHLGCCEEWVGDNLSWQACSNQWFYDLPCVPHLVEIKHSPPSYALLTGTPKVLGITIFNGHGLCTPPIWSKT